MPYFTVNIIIIAIATALGVNSTSHALEIDASSVNKEGIIMVRKDFLFAALVLIIFMGFRNNFTTDYNSYINIFHYACRQTFTDIFSHFNSHIEPGYLTLNKIIGLVSENKIFFMTVIACISVSLVMSEAYSETANIFWFVFLYFNSGIYLMGFNTMRQVLAASITYFSTKYFRKRQYKRLALAMFVAFTIHRSSLFMLAVFPLLGMKVRMKNISVMVILGATAFLFAGNIINIVQQFFYKHYNLSRGESESLITMIIQWGMFAFGCLALRMNRIKADTLTERLLFNSSLIFVMVTILSLKIGMLVRLKYFMSMYLNAFTANAITSVLKGKNMIAYKFLLTLLVFMYLYVRIIHGTYGNYVFLG